MNRLRPPSPTSPTRWSPGVRDAVGAALLTALTQLELVLNAGRVEGPRWLQVATFLGATAAVAWRRRAPLAAAALNAASLSAQTLLAGSAPVSGGFVAFAVVAYSVGAYASRRRRAVGLLVLAVALASYPVAHPEVRALADVTSNAVVLVGAWALGLALGERRRRTVELERHAEVLERDREVATRAALEDERARIARELHDVVAHGVSVMVLQAGAARQVLDTDPGRAREPLLTVEQTGRQALDELHRLLGVLRRGSDGLALDPPASLRQLDALAAQVSASGVRVQVRTEGRVVPLAPGVDLSAYRIVQEALTNALKHAGAATVDVTVRYRTDAVELEVVDDGVGTGAPVAVGGHGLVGMRERAALFGGRLEAGPSPSGGWRVAARLPFDPVPA